MIMELPKKIKKKKLAPVCKGKIARVSIIIQMEALECGAASLGMVLAYYGLWLPLEQLRTDCGVSRDGQSAKKILQAAMLHGLDVEARKYEPEAFFEKGTFPCIVFVGFNHFVVVTGVKGNSVYINDPAGGRKKNNQRRI